MLLDGNCALGVGVNTGVVDEVDVRRRLEGLSDEGGVLGRFAGTEMESLKTAVGEPAVEWRGDSTDGVL